MSTLSNRSLVALVAATLFLLLACTKQYQNLENDPDEIGQFCRLDSLIFAPGMSLDITYNAAGNPVEMGTSPMLTDYFYGTDNYFRYDKFGRLTDVLMTQPGFTFVQIWERYFYPGPGIVGDSVYEYNGHLSDVNPPPGTPLSNVRILQFDEKGRPYKYLYFPGDTSLPKGTGYISYDKNGNVILPGVVYDDKINIYRTSPVWQLINLDYSMNNPISPASSGLPASITGYNKFGLPSAYMNRGAGLGIFDLYYGPLEVSYSCDSKPAPPGYPTTGNATGKE